MWKYTRKIEEVSLETNNQTNYNNNIDYQEQFRMKYFYKKLEITFKKNNNKNKGISFKESIRASGFQKHVLI